MSEHFKTIKHVTKVFSSGYGICREDGCDFNVKHNDDSSPELINHYLNSHGYQILHIGTETFAQDDHVQTITVTTLGK